MLGNISRKHLIISSVLGLSLATAFFAYGLLSGRNYTAEAQFYFESAEEKVSIGSSLNSNLVGSLLGGTGQSLDAQRAIIVITSRTFLKDFLTRHKLLSEAFENGDLNKEMERANNDRNRLLERAYEKFKKKIKINVQKDVQVITLSYTSNDPAKAAEVANALVNDYNEYLKKQKTEQARENIEYLESALTSSNKTDIQKAVASVLESEMRNIIMANSLRASRFVFIDPAVTPTSSNRISPIVLIAGSALIYLSVVILYVFCRRILQHAQ